MFLDDDTATDDEKDVSDIRQDNVIGAKLLAPRMPLLLSQFAKRFEQFSKTSANSSTTMT